MRFKVLSCDALRREICAAAARCPHRADLEFLPAGDTQRRELLALVQDAVDRASSVPQDAIVLAYALCGSGVAGLKSRSVPLVIPRAPDCSGFRPNRRGLCFRSTGWTEEGDESTGRVSLAVAGDDDDAPATRLTYRQRTYVTTAPGGAASGREAAAEFRTPRGDTQFFDRLLSGHWDDHEFLVVPPGWRVAASADGRGIDREPIV